MSVSTGRARAALACALAAAVAGGAGASVARGAGATPATSTTLAPATATPSSAAGAQSARHRRTVVVVRFGQVLARAAIRYAGGRLDLVAGRQLRISLPSGVRPRVTVVGAPTRVTGPLAAGTPEGTVVVRERGRTIADAPLVTARALPSPTLGQRLADYFSRSLTLGLLVGLVACSLLLAILQHRVGRRRRRQPVTGQER